MKSYEEMVKLFENANQRLLIQDTSLFSDTVSERTLCGALMLHMHDIIKSDVSYDGYFTDVEYNRNRGNLKTIRKTITGSDSHIITINCDLILHSRGYHPEQDNLIAVEMKKATRPPAEKKKDKDRLIALTKESFDNAWSYDGHSLPKHVCRYVLGVYYEINYRSKYVKIEYYRQGRYISSYITSFKDEVSHE